mmetsp:Transcript_18002/g.31506  ORF Transcript_18002/g.31506 Transcript_18002/m.31506 type:complete len:94 (-) Transcript_18002:68-349(-)
MASGFNKVGGNAPGRCYSLWSDFIHCMKNDFGNEICYDAKEDYFECLHGLKAKSRLKEVEKERKRLKAEGKPYRRDQVDNPDQVIAEARRQWK